MRANNRFRTAGALALLLAAAVARAQNRAAPTAPVVLDRVVAVVNNQPILQSDVEDELRLSVLDPNRVGESALTPAHALDELISRALIEQQMRQEDLETAQPTQAELQARIQELRAELPECVHRKCATSQGWESFLAAHGLTAAQVENYVRYRMEILRFIEQRFRPGIRVSQTAVERYYRDTLLPQYKPGEAVPPLREVAPRIEEILLERQVNVLFDQWLTSLRAQGDVQVLDPSLESALGHSAAEPNRTAAGGNP